MFTFTFQKCLPLPMNKRVDKFKFITVRGNGINYCNYPKREIMDHIRGYSTRCYNHHEKVIKEIKYPRELWFTSVDKFDPIQQKIESIKNEYPDWIRIVIIPEK